MSFGRTSASEFDLWVPVRSFVDVVVRVVLRPAVFFASMPRHGSLLDPLLFALICVEIATLLGGVLGYLGITEGFGPIKTAGEQGLGVVALNALLAPVVSTAGIFVGATFSHFLVRPIVGAGNSGFEASVKIISYSSVTTLVGWIPMIGILLSLYGLYLVRVGIRKMHGVSSSPWWRRMSLRKGGYRL